MSENTGKSFETKYIGGIMTTIAVEDSGRKFFTENLAKEFIVLIAFA